MIDENFTTIHEDILIAQEKTTEQLSNEILKEHSFIDDQLATDANKEREIAEIERIRAWQIEHTKEKSGLAFDISCEEKLENNRVLNVTPKTREQVRISELQKAELLHANMYAITGSASNDYNTIFIQQTLNAIITSEDDQNAIQQKAEAISSLLLSMNPADVYESMLCRRLLILDNQYVRYMIMAKENQFIELKEKYINMASKLMMRYDQTLETLIRYRRKGEQKVNVTHTYVTVNDGGKAVVSSQFNPKAGGGDKSKNEG